MRILSKISQGIILIIACVMGHNSAYPQDTTTSDQSIQSMTDLEVMLQALEATPPTSAESLPSAGTFWSAQHATDWPPLPADVLGLSAWPLGDGVFVLNDTNVNYVELQASAARSVSSSSTMRMSMMASSLASSYAYGNPVYLTNTAAIPDGSGNMIASFSIAGGTNFVPYDILMSTNVATPVTNWNWIGIGYTSNNYTFNSQPADLGFYILAKPSKTMTVGFGDDTVGQCNVPFGLTNALQVAGGGGQSLALKNDGTVVAWGANYYGEGVVPTNLAGVTMISAGYYHDVALLTNGTVTAWGFDNPALGYYLTNVPPNLTNATVISAQALHTLALRSDGTVVAWGYNTVLGQTNVPAGLTNVTAISAGYQFNLVVSNGTVVAWGDNTAGQCNVPPGLSNVVDVAAGTFHSLALLQNGTVVAWGDDTVGETNVPAGLSNVVAISAGGDPPSGEAYSLALKSDGTVVAWGDDEAADPVGGMSNVIAIANGADHALAVRTGPATPVITFEPTNQYQIAGGSVTFTARGAGLYGVTYQWQTNGVNLSGITNATLTLTNVQAAQAGIYDVVVNDNGGMGSIVSSNANLYLVTPPIIVSETPMPTNQVAIFQTNMTLSVSASAPGQFNGFPLSYQWQFNGTNISGATSTNYSFLADTTSPGTYSVIVSNAVGSASASWQVTLTYVGSYIAPGTLAYYLSTNAVGYASGYSGSSTNETELSGWTYAFYSGTNMALLTNSVWSTNFWLHGVQGLSATAIGISNNIVGGGQYNGTALTVTMVSPRHYLRATHVSVPPGMIAFLDTNNVIYWRTFVQQVDIGNDTSVGILNADLPPSVGYLPVIPANFTNYLPTTSYSYIQGIGMNQHAQLFSQPMTLGNPFVTWNGTNAAPFGLGTNWDISIISGDSSNPEMFLINNQFVLVTHNSTGGNFGSGPNYAYQIDAINQQMHYLSTNNVVGTDYQLTSYSLTNWPTIH
jgi:hypothetical protein